MLLYKEKINKVKENEAKGITKYAEKGAIKKPWNRQKYVVF